MIEYKHQLVRGSSCEESQSGMRNTGCGDANHSCDVCIESRFGSRYCECMEQYRLGLCYSILVKLIASPRPCLSCVRSGTILKYFYLDTKKTLLKERFL